MPRLILTVLVVLAVIYIVPFVVYSFFTLWAGLKPPEDVSPGRMLLSFLVSKGGTAIAFVLIAHLARSALGGQWLTYAALWWIMFIASEIAQAMMPTYSWKEAIAGMISETVYVPSAALITWWMLGIGKG